MSTSTVASPLDGQAVATTHTSTAKLKWIITAVTVVLVIFASVGGFLYFRGKTKASTSKSKQAVKEAESTEAESYSSTSHASGAEEDTAAEDATPASKPKPRAAQFEAKSLGLSHDGEVEQVIELQPFVVNLADDTEAAYLRMGISVGFGNSEAEAASEENAKPNPLLTSRLRNAFLALLMTKTSTDLSTQQGKIQLRRELLKVAQAVVHDKNISAVYITEFLIQK